LGAGVYGISVIRCFGSVDSRIFLFLLGYGKLRGWGDDNGRIAGHH
jgi:hypothetical protein